MQLLKKAPGLARGDIVENESHFRVFQERGNNTEFAVYQFFLIKRFNLKTIKKNEELFAVMPGKTRHLSLNKLLLISSPNIYRAFHFGSIGIFLIP